MSCSGERAPVWIVVAVAARTHPDEKIRTLARLALGRAPGHEH